MTAGNMARPGYPGVQAYPASAGSPAREPSNLGDILERVLDKGIVIAGDIQVNLLDIELLTIKLRLVVASLDTARQVGIDWWEEDPWLSADAARRSAARERRRRPELDDEQELELEAENQRLRDRVRQLESADGDAPQPVIAGQASARRPERR